MNIMTSKCISPKSPFLSYRESLYKFAKQKSLVKSHTYQDAIMQTIGDGLIVGIVLLTIMNFQQQKSKRGTNGYNAAIAMELLHAIIKNKPGENMSTIMMHLSTMSLMYNIHFTMPKETSDTGIILNELCIRVGKIIVSPNEKNCEFNRSIEYEDVFKLNYLNCDNSNKLRNIKFMEYSLYDEYVNATYGQTCTLMFILGWIMGGGCKNKKLEELGQCFGILLKIHDDCKKIVFDIENERGQYNYILNYGIQNTYDIFNKNVEMVNNGLLTLEINTRTMNDILEYIKKTFDKFIETI